MEIWGKFLKDIFLEVAVSALLFAGTWIIRDRIYLGILRLIEENGTEFAYPIPLEMLGNHPELDY